MCNLTNRERVAEFLDHYVEICEKYGLILLGKTVDDFVVPADVETIRKEYKRKNSDPGFEVWLNQYFDFTVSEKTIDYCVNVIEENE